MPLTIKKKEPRKFTVSFCDAPVTVRSMSALDMRNIDRRFPIGKNGQRAQHDGYLAAIIAAACVDDAGQQALTETDVLQLDTGYFWELWGIVGKFLGLMVDEDAPKNSPTPSGSTPPSP